MKTPWLPLKRLLAACTLVIAGHCVAGTAAPGTPPIPFPGGPAKRYLLLNDSYLIDECQCGRPTIQAALRGTFDLRLVESSVLSSRYWVENIQFTANTSPPSTVTGRGTFQIGGEIAVIQQMALSVDIADGSSITACEMKATPGTPGRSFPMMSITVKQTNGTELQTFSLILTAAPVRDLWFSTNGFFCRGVR